MLWAGIETAEHFGPRIRRWAGRLGIRDPAAVSVPGDGAEWVWKQAAEQRPGSRGLLDVYHGCEHLADCAEVLYGEGTAAARAWVESGRQALLRGGAAGVQAHLTAARPEARTGAKRSALEDVAGYFARRSTYLGYAERLALGQSIGSGLVGGRASR